jgi:hypothetical protein
MRQASWTKPRKILDIRSLSYLPWILVAGIAFRTLTGEGISLALA